jgi:hypothetical protein
MQLDKNFKICILLLLFPLESCFGNTILPLSKQSAIQKIDSATAKSMYINKKLPIEKEKFPKEHEITATDHLSIHTHDITTDNNASDNSEQPNSFFKRDIEVTRSFSRERKENKLKTQNKLEERTFKTRQGGYTIRFYKRSGKWIAKVTDYDKKEYDLPAFLSEEDVKHLIYSVPTTTGSIQVILPTTSKEGYVYMGILVGGMKRKEPEKEEEEENSNVAPKPNTNNKSAISNPEKDTTISTPVPKPRRSLSLRKKIEPEGDNNPSLVLPTTTTSSTSDISDKKRKIEEKRKEKGKEKENDEEADNLSSDREKEGNSSVAPKPNTNNKPAISNPEKDTTIPTPVPKPRRSLSLRKKIEPEGDNNPSLVLPSLVLPTTTTTSSTSDISDKKRKIEEKRKEKGKEKENDEEAEGSLDYSIKSEENLYRGKNIFQEAKKLLAESLKEKKEEIFQQKVREAITKYKNAAYLGYKPAQDKLIKLRDGKNGVEYNKIIPYVIKNSKVAEESLRTLRNNHQFRNNELPLQNHVLKLSDLIIITELDLQKAPQRIEWGGEIRGKLLYEPLFEMPATEKYEGMVMVIDLAGKGDDETAYCVAKRYKDYYFIMAVGGIGGAYVENKEERLPALPNMLDEITKIIKEYDVKFIRIENNIDGSYEIVLRRHLAENFIQAQVQGYHQGSELTDNTESDTQNEEVKSIGKANRIISSLQSLLKKHRVIISKKAFLKDLNSVPENNFNYKFFFQLESVTIPPDTKKYRHDDRIDATASAVSYLYKKREEEKKKKKQYKRSKDFLKLAQMYSQEKKLKTGEKQIKKAQKAYNSYEQQHKTEYSSDFAEDGPDLDKERTPTMSLCECEMGWLQVKYLNKQEEGIQNLNKAAKDKYPKAQYRLAKIYLKQGKEKEGIGLLKKVASDNAKAQYRLAKIYLRKGKEEGITFLEKAANRNVKAKYRFATMFFKSHEDRARKKKAIEYFKELAANIETLEKLAHKDPEINYKLGCIYYQIDTSGKMEPRKALNYFLRYLNSESDITSPTYKSAAYQIAKIYERSQGLDNSDLDLALEYYTKATDLEDKEDKIQKRIKKLNEYKSKNVA